MQVNQETRDAVGLKNRVFSELTIEELQELVGTYMLEGYDALRIKYGLSRGEVIQLLSSKQGAVLAGSLMQGMRVGLVTRTMVSVPRLLAALEVKVEKDSTTVPEAIEAVKAAKEIFMDVSGAGMSRMSTHIPGNAEPSDMIDSEATKAARLQNHIAALSDAKLIQDTPKHGRNGSNGNGNGNGVA